MPRGPGGGPFASLTKHPHTSGQVDNPVDGGRGSTVANSKCKTDICISRLLSPGLVLKAAAAKRITKTSRPDRTMDTISSKRACTCRPDSGGSRHACLKLPFYVSGARGMDGGPGTSARSEPRQAVHPLSIGEAGGGSQTASGRWTPGAPDEAQLGGANLFGLEAFGDPSKRSIHQVSMGATCSFMACGNKPPRSRAG